MVTGQQYLMQKIKNKINKFFVYQFESFFHVDSPDTKLESIYLDKGKYTRIPELLIENNADSVDFIHINSSPSLVPVDHFEEKLLEDYLKTNTNLINQITYDTTYDEKIKVVYSIDDLMKTPLNKMSIKLENYNHFTFIYNLLLKNNTNSNGLSFFIILNDKSFDIIIFDKNKFIFFNTFKINGKDEFLYYLFFVIKNFELSSSQEEIVFLGRFDRYADFYESVSKFSKISFVINSNLSLLNYKEESFSVINENYLWT